MRRAAWRERQAAEVLRTSRALRDRFEPGPDCAPVTLPCGLTLAPEVKTRARLPVFVTRALDQAHAYGPIGSVPIAVLSATGSEPIVVLPFRAFCTIAGLDTATDDAELRLPFARPAAAPGSAAPTAGAMSVGELAR